MFLETWSPEWWVMLGRYDAEWDAELNKLLDEHDFKPKYFDIRPDLKDAWINIFGLESWNKASTPSRYEAMLGNRVLWVQNYPYGAFHGPKKNTRPSRRTILRAWRKFQKDKAQWILE